jgi:hypothetical protein
VLNILWLRIMDRRPATLTVIVSLVIGMVKWVLGWSARAKAEGCRCFQGRSVGLLGASLALGSRIGRFDEATLVRQKCLGEW